MTSADLQSILQQPYERQRWGQALRGVLPGTELFTVAQPVATANTQARQIHQLGRIRLAGGRNLAALEIVLDPTVDLIRNRVGLRNLVARFIDQAEYHGVLAVFLTEHPGYRFTFAASESVFDDAGHVTRVETAPRRYTYILGPGEACRTPAERFAQLAAKGTAAALSDVIDAFSVDKLNKEFFADFCRAFEQVTTDIQRRHRAWPDASVEREAQTLLDRLLFLYFVQRKGWLNRQRGYLISHFREHHEARPKGTSYVDQFLRPLFVKLSTEGPVADIAGHDLPFLNGGLFNDEYGDEQNDDTARRHKELTVGNDTFHFVFENLLERYNFTIHEDSPGNQEVAIDPEMLGKIFESLVLQIEQSGTGGKSLRHDTGSVYTPRPIVHYQCREALAAWLETQCPVAASRQSAADSPAKQDGHALPSAATTSDWPARVRKLLSLDASDGIDDAERTTLAECLTPEEAAQLLDRIFDLRACDPAVGSGAFAMGLLRELVNLARLCETRARGRDPIEGDRAWLYETKKRLIERVIYGVDIQERAVEICKLRLWLSLMVDHDLGVEPADCDARAFRKALKALEPLPNLDFKIRRANSLVDHIHGEPVELSALSREAGAAVPLSRLGSAKREFFNAHTAAAKRRLRLDIYEALTQLARIELTRARTDAAGFGLALDEKSTRRVAELDHGLKEIGFITAQVHDARKLRAAQQDEALERIRAQFDDPDKPTFVWQLDFAEVFHRKDSVGRVPSRGGALLPEGDDETPGQGTRPTPGGFDIIVSNPPYVRIQVLNQTAPEQVAWFKQYYTAAAKGNYDLYVVFVERGLQLLAPGGQFSYILPHKFFNAQYGQPLRELLAKGRHLRHVVHFGDQQVFAGATNYVCLLFLAKAGADACRWVRADDLAGWLRTLTAREAALPAARFTPAEWNFAGSMADALLEKLRRSGKRLLDLPADMSRGHSTGDDEVFVVEAGKEEVGTEILRVPVYATDFRRYSYVPNSQWRVIFPYRERAGVLELIPEGELRREFPKAFDHLSSNRKKLNQRKGARVWYGFSAPRNLELHDKAQMLVPLLADTGSFAPVPPKLLGKLCPMASGGFTISAASSPYRLDYLLALLNSRLLFWMMLRTSNLFHGGWITCTKQYFGELPIRLINFSVASERAEHDALAGLVGRILAAKRAAPAADTTALEREIDARIYRLYDLTPDEIKLVEEAGK